MSPNNKTMVFAHTAMNDDHDAFISQVKKGEQTAED